MLKKEIEQLRHFLHLMDACYKDVEEAQTGKDAMKLDEAQTELAMTESAWLDYMQEILVEAGRIPQAADMNADF